MDQRTLREFAARIERGELGAEVQVRYHVAGGMPSQRVDCTVTLDAVRGADISRLNTQISDRTEYESISPDRLDVADLFREVRHGLQSLAPTEEHMQWVPDGLMGTLTIVVDGAEESFRFVPEREKRATRTTFITPVMDRALQQFWILAFGEPSEKGRP
ncbi:hypothetical protein [Nocardia sp. NPDC058480]|uniref:hypothetical protein n=1 Tax=unclassified Nocardia TaxID=2637762 RepID=UPI003659ED79